MIDIESQVFTTVATALRNEYGASNIYVAPEYVSQPPKFPAVFIVEQDNTVHLRGRDSANIENFVNVMYQVDVFSNQNTGKKVQAKEIIALVDDQFAQMGFSDYLNYIRYTKASELIREGMTATSAAMRSGFGSMNTFYRAKNKYDTRYS